MRNCQWSLEVEHPGASTDSVLFFYPLFNLATEVILSQRLLTQLLVSDTRWTLHLHPPILPSTHPSTHPFIRLYNHSTKSWILLYFRHYAGRGLNRQDLGWWGPTSLEERTGSIVVGSGGGGRSRRWERPSLSLMWPYWELLSVDLRQVHMPFWISVLSFSICPDIMC